MKIITITAGIMLLLSGCAPSTTLITHDTIQFKGDTHPNVTSTEALAGDLSNLTEGETLVIATAKDNSGALSRPNPVAVDVVETVLVDAAKERNLEQLWARCDPDRDGILDFYCPELLSHRKFVTFETAYGVYDKRNKDKDAQSVFRGGALTINISESKNRDIPVHLNMLTLNRGNKSFEGDLIIHARVPPQVKVTKITRAVKVRDNTKRQNAIGSIPIFGVIALAMDWIGEVSTNAIFDTKITPAGDVELTVKGIKVEPGEGVRLDYEVVYDSSGVN